MFEEDHHMKKNKDTENFDRIMAGLGEVAEIVAGRAEPARVYVPVDIDVKAIRTRFGLSQEAFAVRFGFKKATVQDWEQRRRTPEASARVLLTVIDREPAAVLRALEAA
jgi:putative transcriptional regulator